MCVIGYVQKFGCRLAPQCALLWPTLCLGKLQARKAHSMVDDDQSLCIEQRIRAQLALRLDEGDGPQAAK